MEFWDEVRRAVLNCAPFVVFDCLVAWEVGVVFG